jgi:hypothetical protein
MISNRHHHMKKIFATILVFVTLAGSIGAQCKYGPRVSAGLSSFGGGNSGVGIQAGIFINAELKDRIGIQGEVLYSVFNGSKDVKSYDVASASYVTNTEKYHFVYINVPVYGFVHLSDHINFLAGPMFGIINKATEELTGPNITGDNTQDISGVKTKLGFAAGIDFQLSSPLRLGLRFSSNGGDPFSGKATFVGATMAYDMDW